MFYGGAHAVSLDAESRELEGAGDSRRGGVYLEI